MTDWSTEFKLAAAAVLVTVVLVSCATQPPPGYYNQPYQSGDTYAPGSVAGQGDTGRLPGYGGAVVQSSIAVLGVVSAETGLREFQRKILANELESYVRAQHESAAVLPFSQVRAALSSQSQHRLMLDRYKINGKLTEADWGVLRASVLPVQYVLIARIDRDDTSRFQPIKTPMKNSHGDSLTDRQQVTLVQQRRVEVAARLYDVTTASEVWAGAFVSEPVNKTSYTEYTGSSFTGSMATLLTNSFVNGRAGKKYPPAPSSSEALRQAFKRIAAAVAAGAT